MKFLEPDRLALLVTNVTRTMCGLAFVRSEQGAPEPVPWRFAVLRIPDGRLSVGISADQAGCTALAAGMFGCPPTQVEPSLVEDALRELCNMVAGQVRFALALDQALGLPEIVPNVDLKPSLIEKDGQLLWLASGGLRLAVWLSKRMSV